MACGKTTLGTALAGSAGVMFIDLDAEIERLAGCSIARYFNDYGEQAFRELEADTLRCVIAEHYGRQQPVIIACGGGTPCHGDNQQQMLAAGRVIWLRASRERTIARLLDAPPGSRPLMAGLDAQSIARRIDHDLEIRTPHYSRAHHIFDSSYLDTPGEVARTTADFIERFLDQNPAPDDFTL